MKRRKGRVDTTNATLLKRGTYASTLAQIAQEGHCPFCAPHLTKHHPRPILFKDRYWLATENNWPYEGAKHHFLLISASHTERLEELSTAAWRSLHELCKKLAKKYRYTGETFFLRSGDTALTGASVNHLHAHIVVGGPRAPKKKLIRALIGFSV